MEGAFFREAGIEVHCGPAGIPRKAGEHMKPKKQTNCDSCVNYVYDEDYEYYVCEANLDEDDMARFLGNQSFSCPYYQLDDEYAVVRHQM